MSATVQLWLVVEFSGKRGLTCALLWCLRYFTEDTVDPIAIVAGLIQTGLFSGEQPPSPRDYPCHGLG